MEYEHTYKQLCLYVQEVMNYRLKVSQLREFSRILQIKKFLDDMIPIFKSSK